MGRQKGEEKVYCETKDVYMVILILENGSGGTAGGRETNLNFQMKNKMELV